MWAMPGFNVGTMVGLLVGLGYGICIGWMAHHVWHTWLRMRGWSK